MTVTGHGNGNVKAEIIKRKLMLKAGYYDHVLSLWTKVYSKVQGLIFSHAADFKQKSLNKTNSPSK